MSAVFDVCGKSGKHNNILSDYINASHYLSEYEPPHIESHIETHIESHIHGLLLYISVCDVFTPTIKCYHYKPFKSCINII